MYVNWRLRKRNFALGTCVIFLVSLIFSWTQRDQTPPQVLAKCQKLKGLLGSGNLLAKSAFLHMTASEEELVHAVEKWYVQGENKRILQHLLLTQQCPWKPNATSLAQYRTELGRCCNASFWLAVTKENTPLGSYIVFDGQKWKNFSVNAELIDLLPKRSPLLGVPYERCAVVGNGGILQNSSCGPEIDQADFIVRFNLPPMKHSEDVGTKTSLVTINPSILQTTFKELLARRKPFADTLRRYRNALVFIPAFSFPGHNEVSYRALYTMEEFGMAQKAYFLNPHYLAALEKYWKNQGLQPLRLSSGFMLANMALELCKHITLYGFWPLPHDLANRPISHHYYDNILPKPGVHAMSGEFLHYLKMYSQGVLRLRLGQCQ